MAHVERKEVIVVHTGRRDNYEVAKAFDERDVLVNLVTDFYYKPGTLGGAMAKLFFGRGVYKRHRADLNVIVHSSILLITLDFLERFFPRRKVINKFRAKALGQKAVSVAKKRSISAAIFYYNSGMSHYSQSTSRIGRLVLFQMHPHAGLIRNIYRGYLKCRPEVEDDLSSQEEELTNDARYATSLESEASSSDRIICTSTFTLRSLEWSNLVLPSIAVVPYGANLSFSDEQHRDLNALSPSNTLRLAFVGQFIVRKGLYELLRIVKKRPDISLSVFTRDVAFARAATLRWIGELPSNLVFQRILDDSEMWSQASRADFLVLPSLVEGFGLVILEAMSIGLPVIASRNTAAPDLLQEGVSGYLLDDFLEPDIEAVCDKAIQRRKSWPQMRAQASAGAKGASWARFRQQVFAFAMTEDKLPPTDKVA